MGPSGKNVLCLNNNNIPMDMCLLPSVLCVCLDLNCCSTTALRCFTSQQLPPYVCMWLLSSCQCVKISLNGFGHVKVVHYL